MTYEVLPTEEAQAFRARASILIVANLQTTGFGVTDLAREMGASPRHFQRRCRQLSGQNPIAFIRGIRLDQARLLLAGGVCRTVGDVALAVGMSASHLSRSYMAHYGRAPSEDLAYACVYARSTVTDFP